MTASKAHRVWRGCSIVPASLLAVGTLAWNLVAWSQQSPAARDTHTSFELRAGAFQSDNIRRTPDGEKDGTIYTAGLGVDVERDGRRLDASAHGNLELMDYPQDTFSTELSGYFDGIVTYDIVPEALKWRLQDTYGQQITNAFVASTPDSLEGVNYLTTGPQFNMHLGGNMSLAVNADYSLTHHERTTDLDNQRIGGRVGLVRELSHSNTVSLNAMAQHFSFDENSFQDNYNQQEFYASYDVEGRRGALSVDLGYSVLDPRGEQSHGLLARVDLERQIAGGSRINLYYAHQFSASGDIFRSRVEHNPSGAPLPLAIADAFRDDTAGFLWNYELRRTRISFGGSQSKEEYRGLSEENNRKVRSAHGDLQRRMGPRLTLLIEGFWQSEKFENVDFDAHEKGGRVSLQRTFGHSLGVDLQYSYHDRTSSNPLTAYTESRYGLSVFYRPVRR